MNRKSLLLMSIILLISLTLTACGGGEKSGSNDKLTIATGGDAISLDPIAQNDAPSANVMVQIYDGLVQLDEENNVHPKLAESFETPDDLTYIFHLKKGIKFHNGEELKASDVKFTFERALKAPAVAHIFADIDPDSLETPDDYTFQFKLKEPYAGTLTALCHPAAFIVNEKAVKEAGDKYDMEPVGTGAFKFVSWTKADRIVLERFDDYHGKKPEFKTLEIRVIPEPTNRIVELETGGIDIAYDVSPNDIKRVEENKDLQLFRQFDYSTQYLGMNTQKPPFDDVRVRQAIVHAIDMEQINKAVWKGIGRTATGPYAPTIKYSIAEEREPIKRDVEKAKQLLKEAGYENGFKATISTNDRQERIDMATIIKEQLSEVGIDVNIDVLEWGAYIELLESGKQDMFEIAWISDTPDPDMVVYPCFHSSMVGPGGNYVFLEDPEIDDMIIKGRRTPDGPEREKIYKELQERIMELAPAIFQYNGEVVIGARKGISNIGLTPFGHHRLYTITFDE